MNRALASLLAFALAFAPACASTGGARHNATVTVVASHAVLTTIDDTEMQIVCGKPTAPAAPMCVPIETHRQISGLLAQAYGLEAQVARIVRALPLGAPTPQEVVDLTIQIGALVNQIVALIPQSQEKAVLVQKINPPQVR